MSQKVHIPTLEQLNLMSEDQIMELLISLRDMYSRLMQGDDEQANFYNTDITLDKSDATLLLKKTINSLDFFSSYFILGELLIDSIQRQQPWWKRIFKSNINYKQSLETLMKTRKRVSLLLEHVEQSDANIFDISSEVNYAANSWIRAYETELSRSEPYRN